METILPAFIVVILLLFAVLTPAQSYLAAQDQLQASRQLMDQRLIDQARTDLTPVSHYISNDGVVVHMTVRNSGQTKLADFDQWDMILQYYDSGYVYHIVRVPYADANTQVLNTWSVVSISQDLFDPGIFNPGESITVRLEVSPAVGPETANRVELATPSGVGVTTVFYGPPFPPTPTAPAPQP
jgi:archaellum component FlaF (FlaF/FlaG flagellin family)